MSDIQPRFAPLGDGAITITFGDSVDAALAARVRGAAASVRRSGVAAIVDVVPAYAALTVHYDPMHMDYAELAEILEQLVSSPAVREAAEVGRRHEIPVRYDGPDLAEVARGCGMTEAEVAARHCAPEYRVELVGFVPGFAYLAPLDPALVLPRRARPRTRVPAGSVAIGGAQTGIYPLETPGGWHLLGHTSVVLFDAGAEPPALLRAGDVVRFRRVDA